ncbi:MAG: hypothetical protein K9K67_14965 [Bacteriovoracaceae bacterium]|nr:hypothetical protein [Bacteriovoracaceae bacterium]
MKSFMFCFFLLFTVTSPASFKIVDGQIILDNLDGYALCQKGDRSGHWCYDALKRYVFNNPKLAWQAAILTRGSMNSSASIPFFWLAQSSPEFDCSNTGLILAIKSAYQLGEGQREVVEKAHEISFKKCSQIIPQQLDGALNPESKYIFQNYCSDFVKRGVIRGVLKKKCLNIK